MHFESGELYFHTPKQISRWGMVAVALRSSSADKARIRLEVKGKTETCCDNRVDDTLQTTVFIF